MGKPSDAEMSDLTEEERAALAEDDEEETAAEAAAQATGDEDADKAEAEAAGEGEGEGQGEKSPAPTDDDAAKAAGTDDGEATDQDEPASAADTAAQSAPKDEAPQPRHDALPQAPADADEKLADIAQRKKELVQKFDNGELTSEELFDAKDKLDEEALEIKLSVREAQRAAEQAERAWFGSIVPDFLASHGAYDAEKNPTVFSMMNAEVTRLQNEAIEAGRNPFVPSILTAAHENITKAIAGLSGQPPAEPKKAAPQPKPEMPPTLANVPAAEHHDVDGGKFASLDRLADRDPLAFEDAFAKLPESDREAYLARQ